MIKKCEYCKETFLIRKKYPKQKYCSLLCRNKGLTTRNGRFIICLICSKEFYTNHASTQKYCSVECKNNIPAILIKCICQYCRKDFTVFTKQPYRPPLACKICVQKKSKNRSRKSKYYNNRRLVLSVSKCEKCEYNKSVSILGVHHINKDRSNTDKSNLIVLCPNCHSLEHSKHLVHSLIRQTE